MCKYIVQVDAYKDAGTHFCMFKYGHKSLLWCIFMLLQMTAALNYFLFMGLDSAANNKIMTKLLFSVFISGLLYFAVVVETPHQAVSLSVLMAVSLNSLKLHKYINTTYGFTVYVQLTLEFLGIGGGRGSNPFLKDAVICKLMFRVSFTHLLLHTVHNFHPLKVFLFPPLHEPCSNHCSLLFPECKVERNKHVVSQKLCLSSNRVLICLMHHSLNNFSPGKKY